MPISVLTFSTLYPNRRMPQHGIFVEHRLRHLVDSGEVAATVVAPVPWFPATARCFGRYGTFARVPREEVRHGIAVMHPRYPVLPKIGMSAAPLLMYRALRRHLAELQERLAFEIIDAHYFYPDGVAAVMLGRALGRPVVITARGTDVNLLPQYRIPRRWIRWAAAHAAGIVAVADALRDRLVALGIDRERVRVVRNGVDLDLFSPCERDAARQEFDLAGPVILSVGALVAHKAHDLVIRSLTALPDVTLAVVGEGPEAPKLRRLAGALGLNERVRLLGAMSQDRLARAYGAADAVVLASSREGLPNVLLEAMACGTPVVATAVSGTPEIIEMPLAGRLVAARTPHALATAIREVLDDPSPRATVRAHAARFSWSATTARQLDLFRSILSPGT
jgi:glycosyltransferase involved in cell wall biosynthesis